MLDIALRDGLRDRAVWLGGALVSASVSFFLVLCTDFLLAVAQATPDVFTRPGAPGTRDELVEMGANLLLYSGVPALLVLTIVLGSVSRQMAESHARWRLAGASPRGVTTIFGAQAAIACFVGAMAGAMLSLPTQPAFNAIVMRGPGSGLPLVRSPLAVVGTGLVLSVLGWACALVPARRASRLSPVLALTGHEPPRSRRGRWIVPVLFTMLVVLPLLTTVVAVPRLDQPVLGVLAMLPAGQALVIATALYLPLVLRRVVLIWTGLPGLNRHVPWHLARHMAAERAGQAAATVAPLMVGMGLFCSFSMVGTTASHVAPAAGPQVNLFDGTLMLAPIGVIAAIGSAAVVYMASRRRAHDVSALRAAGADEHGTRLMFAYEAVIYVGTAGLCLVVPLAAQAGLVAIPLSVHHLALSLIGLDPVPALVVGAIGGLTTLVIVATTGMASWRRPLAESLREASA